MRTRETESMKNNVVLRKQLIIYLCLHPNSVGQMHTYKCIYIYICIYTKILIFLLYLTTLRHIKNNNVYKNSKVDWRKKLRVILKYN
jgi:hypothetical protein